MEPLEPERRLGPTQTLQSDKCAQCGEQSSVAARGTLHVARVCAQDTGECRHTNVVLENWSNVYRGTLCSAKDDALSDTRLDKSTTLYYQ